MAAGNRKLRSFVNRLLELSKTDGVMDGEKVADVLSTLRKSGIKPLRPVLEQYRFVVRKEIRETTARVYHAGRVSEEARKKLAAALEEKSGRKLILELKEDPDLIAGLKIAVGDYVYDHSAKRLLQQISETI